MGGHVHELALAEDAPELRALFTALVEREAGTAVSSPLLQIPLDGGRSALTVAAEHVVAVVTTPPVLVQTEAAAPPAAAVVRPGCMVIDDFLGPDEHHDMLAFVLRERDRFEPSTVEGRKDVGRRNSVIMHFSHQAHARLLGNRILVWLPVILKALGRPMFPLGAVESQLTASNHGDYYRAHLDSGDPSMERRELSCVYYFHRQPKGFAGGALRLHDAFESAEGLVPAGTFQEIEPESNRLVVFPSRTYHELMPIRCPSRDFADGRFAITTWLHGRADAAADARFGWGHFRVGASGAEARA